MTAVSTTPIEEAAPADRMSRREVLQALSGLMIGMFVSILASTVVSNALPRIIADLHGSQNVYTWIVTTELLAMTATVPLWGKMADLYNKKLLIQLSLGLFVAGSLIAGFTPNVGVLILSRLVQGVGAGGMTALAMIVMAAMIPPRELGRYSGIFGAVFGVGTIAGPLIGGLLVDRFGKVRIFVAIASLIFVPSGAVLFLVPTYPGFVVALAILGVAFGIYTAVDQVLITRVLPGNGNAARDLGILNIANAGDHLVSSPRLYGGTYNLFHYTFPRMGIGVKFVDQSDPANFKKAIDKKTIVSMDMKKSS